MPAVALSTARGNTTACSAVLGPLPRILGKLNEVDLISMAALSVPDARGRRARARRTCFLARRSRWLLLLPSMVRRARPSPLTRRAAHCQRGSPQEERTHRATNARRPAAGAAGNIAPWSNIFAELRGDKYGEHLLERWVNLGKQPSHSSPAGRRSGRPRGVAQQDDVRASDGQKDPLQAIEPLDRGRSTPLTTGRAINHSPVRSFPSNDAHFTKGPRPALLRITSRPRVWGPNGFDRVRRDFSCADEVRTQAFLAHRLHHPSGLTWPATSLHVFDSATKFRQPLHFCSPFG